MALPNPVREMLHLAKVSQCIACAKCIVTCPMAEMFPYSRTMSPMGMVQQALANPESEKPLDGSQGCVQCHNCAKTCPAGVDASALATTPDQLYCQQCQAPLLPQAAQEYLHTALAQIMPNPSDWDNPDNPGEAYLLLCPICRQQAYISHNQ